MLWIHSPPKYAVGRPRIDGVNDVSTTTRRCREEGARLVHDILSWIVRYEYLLSSHSTTWYSEGLFAAASPAIIASIHPQYLRDIPDHVGCIYPPDNERIIPADHDSSVYDALVKAESLYIPACSKAGDSRDLSPPSFFQMEALAPFVEAFSLILPRIPSLDERVEKRFAPPNSYYDCSMRGAVMKLAYELGVGAKKARQISVVAGIADIVAQLSARQELDLSPIRDDAVLSAAMVAHKCSHIVDCGAGKGYLSLLLSIAAGHHALAIEGNPSNVDSLRKFVQTIFFKAWEISRSKPRSGLDTALKRFLHSGSFHAVPLFIYAGDSGTALIQNFKNDDRVEVHEDVIETSVASAAASSRGRVEVQRFGPKQETERAPILVGIHPCGGLGIAMCEDFSCAGSVHPSSSATSPGFVSVPCCYNAIISQCCIRPEDRSTRSHLPFSKVLAKELDALKLRLDFPALALANCAGVTYSYSPRSMALLHYRSVAEFVLAAHTRINKIPTGAERIERAVVDCDRGKNYRSLSLGASETRYPRIGPTPQHVQTGEDYLALVAQRTGYQFTEEVLLAALVDAVRAVRKVGWLEALLRLFARRHSSVELADDESTALELIRATGGSHSGALFAFLEPLQYTIPLHMIARTVGGALLESLLLLDRALGTEERAALSDKLSGSGPSGVVLCPIFEPSVTPRCRLLGGVRTDEHLWCEFLSLLHQRDN